MRRESHNLPEAILKIAERIISRTAAESSNISEDYFGRSDLAVEYKEDCSPVSEADKLLEERIRKIILQEAPSHGIIGEEGGTERGDAEYVWTVDPIDGTISFVAGVPFFGTQLALLLNGVAVLGSIYMPVLKTQVIGDGTVTKTNGIPVRLRTVSDLSQAKVAVTDIGDVIKFFDGAAFNRLAAQVATVRTWGDCYGYTLLASGRVDVMLDAAINPWDIAPLAPIIHGAGGITTDWHGNPLQPRPFEFATSCIAAHAGLHGAVVAALRGREGGAEC